MLVNFDQPQPTVTQKETIYRPAIEQVDQHQTYGTLNIPVEDQRLVATPANVGYDVPKYMYQFVPVF